MAKEKNGDEIKCSIKVKKSIVDRYKRIGEINRRSAGAEMAIGLEKHIATLDGKK